MTQSSHSLYSKYALFFLTLFTGAVLFATDAHANPKGPTVIAANASDFDTARPGETAPVLYVTVQRGASDNFIENVSVTTNVTAPGVDDILFGNSADRVNQVSVYLDGNTIGEWEVTDTLIGSFTATSDVQNSPDRVTIDVTRIDLDAPGETVKLFFVYKYGSAIPEGSEVGFLINRFQWLDNPNEPSATVLVNGDVSATTGNSVEMFAPLSGLEPMIVSANYQDFDLINPDEKDAVFNFTVQKGATLNIIDQLIIGNETAGSVKFGNGSNEVRELSVFIDSNSNGIWDDGVDTQIVDKVFGGGETNLSSVTLNLTPAINLDVPDEQRHLFVVYSIGNDVPDGSFAQVKINGMRWDNGTSTNFLVRTTDPGNSTATDSSTVFIEASNTEIIAISSENASILPRGTTGDVKYLRVRNIGGNTVSLEKFLVENRGATTVFGNGSDEINKVAIYFDANNDRVFNSATDNLIGSHSFLSSFSGTIATVSVTHAMSDGDIDGFFVTYVPGDDVVLSSTANAKVTQIKWGIGGSDIYNPNTSTSNVVISGINIASTKNAVVESFALPGDAIRPMLRLQINPSGENFVLDSLTVSNNDDNFDFNLDSTGNILSVNQGVTKVWLYRSTDNVFDGADTLLQAISTSNAAATSGNTTSQVVFSAFATQTLTAGVTTNFFVLYDIGGLTDIRNARFDAVKSHVGIDGISGHGESTNLPISNSQQFPSTPAESLLAGLSFSTSNAVLKSIVPPNNIFGAGMTAPMLQFSLTAEGFTVSINAVSIQNTASLPFGTSSLNNNKVKKAYLYTDSSSLDNDSFDGEPNDTLLAEVALNGGNNTATVVTFNFSTNVEITTGNSIPFYVVYDFGTTVPVSSANARLFGATGLGETTAGVTRSVRLAGSLPAAASPDAVVSLLEVNVTVLEVVELHPSVSVSGQLNLPMLSVRLSTDENIPSASMTIIDPQGTLKSNNDGVRKVKVYQDVAPLRVLNSSDTLLGSTTSFTNNGQTAVVNNIPIHDGDDNYYIVAYDVGHEAEDETFTAQLSNVNFGSSSGFTVGGNFPFPTNATTVLAYVPFMQLTDMTISTSSISNTSPTFTIQVVGRNIHTDRTIGVTTVRPRFYKDTISGQDRSYEFAVTNLTPANYPVIAVQNSGGDTVTFNFLVSPRNVTQTGFYQVDAYLEYLVSSNAAVTFNVPAAYYSTNNATAVVERYRGQGGIMKFAVNDGNDSNDKLFVESALSIVGTAVPAYITSMEVQSSGTSAWIEFQPGHAILANSQMRITFADNGNSIDENSISLSINGTTYIKQAQAIGDALTEFYYNYSNGVLLINDIGNSDGTMILSLNDNTGNPLETFSPTFFVSETLEVDNFLVYPNPYSPAVNPILSFGFSLTQPARIEIYLYDSTGREVARLPETTHIQAGYKLFEWRSILSRTGKYIPAGIYIARMVATDNDGRRVFKTTKIAVY